MSVSSIATLSAIFAALVAALAGAAAHAAPCDVTKTVTRNFVWSVLQTTGPGLNNTSVFRQNNGPFSNVVTGSATLAGSFTFDASHTPPTPLLRPA
jgi:hypothetical protein